MRIVVIGVIVVKMNSKSEHNPTSKNSWNVCNYLKIQKTVKGISKVVFKDPLQYLN